MQYTLRSIVCAFIIVENWGCIGCALGIPALDFN